jgi:N6-adenosine-specific RNA methylase IME4/ParB-like chromosome segregation protein Spo0J
MKRLTDQQIVTSMALADIRVGERHRRDMGDLDGLAASVAELGLLQPIVVRPDGLLIAGERRFLVAQQLGWSEIPVNVVDLEAVARGEYAENTYRKDFTLSESVAIKRALEPIEKAAARQRMLAGKPSGKFPKGRALDHVAKVAGRDRRTLERAEAIVDAAEAEPERFGKLLAAMDRTGRVNGVFKSLKALKQAERIRAEPPPLPGRGPYRVIVIDPPWEDAIRANDPSRRVNNPFPGMSVEAICKLDILSIAAPDFILWMWVTNHELLRSIHTRILVDAWGLQPKALLTWGKTNGFGCGDSLRGQTEHCVMAVRGSPIVTLTRESTLLLAPARGHSSKPPEFYDLVESLCPAPRYADLFSRYRHNDKWDCHGDEAPLVERPCGALEGSRARILAAIRARAAGGRSWKPPEPQPCLDNPDIPEFLKRAPP